MKIQTPKAKNAEHLDYIRNLPCLVCGDNTATEAAHVRRADARAAKKITGIGIKPGDCWTIPLCSRHHRRQHEVGEAHFWDTWGIDPVFTAMALWLHTGDIESGEEICKQRPASFPGGSSAVTAICDSYAKENQQFHDEIERLRRAGYEAYSNGYKDARNTAIEECKQALTNVVCLHCGSDNTDRLIKALGALKEKNE